MPKLLGRKAGRQRTPLTAQEIQRKVERLSKMSFRDVDKELEVTQVNDALPQKGYLSPSYYRRQDVESDDHRQQRQRRVAKVLNKK